MPTKIEWCDETINPLGWGCYGPEGTPENPKRCSYCYAYRMAKRSFRDCPQCREFVPHWHPEQYNRLQDFTQPKRIFLQSMGDLWHPAISYSLKRNAMSYVQYYPQHTFLALTKCAEAAYRFFQEYKPEALTPNLHFGITAENQPALEKRVFWLLRIPGIAIRWVSLEPLLGDIDLTNIQSDKWTRMNVLEGCGVTTRPGISGQSLPNCYCERISWVVIGAMTGPGAIKPKLEWIQSIVDQCRVAGVPVFLKDNLQDIWPGKLIQEFPEVA